MNKSYDLIAKYIRSHPDATWQQVASVFGVSTSTISRIAKACGLARPVGLKLDLLAAAYGSNRETK
jgi:DNA-binding MurR/RpiR family transcriptional regulator